ncbi:MAG: hypothetical protein C4519_28430 [Desulfobacteraceae bacterium]|nr:MAG: hypothetical protein C4519_28430 [Desulfobacteraceae bacterium]
MPNTIAHYQRLKQIELEIKEARQRLPAHSVKPVLMQALFTLEDERDAILKQLRALPQDPVNPLGQPRPFGLAPPLN